MVQGHGACVRVYVCVCVWVVIHTFIWPKWADHSSELLKRGCPPLFINACSLSLSLSISPPLNNSHIWGFHLSDRSLIALIGHKQQNRQDVYSQLRFLITQEFSWYLRVCLLHEWESKLHVFLRTLASIDESFHLSSLNYSSIHNGPACTQHPTGSSFQQHI